jgi:hypothetical protein
MMIGLRSLAIVTFVCFFTTPVWAFDPLGTDILTLRLGSPEATVIDHLTHQGWQLTRAGHCAAQNCPDPIQALTEDGVLLVDFAPGGLVRRVTYTLTASNEQEAGLVRDAIMEHFGRPSIESPVSWCHAPGADGQCPPTQPRLTFKPAENFGGVLTLAASGS